MKRRIVQILLAVAVSATAWAPARADGPPEFRVRASDLRGMSPRMQRTIAGLSVLLNGYQMRQLLSLPSDSARAEWIDRFWRSKDPTPTTPENEMRREHELRVGVALRAFASRRWPGWDKRGEVFIRYGPPDIRARIPAEVTARRVHAPGELWYYRRHDMLVVFRDESLTGHYVYAINALGAVQDMTPELAEYLIYDTGRSLDAIIPAEYLEFYRDPEIDPDVPNDVGSLREALQGPMPVRVIRPRMRGVTERIDENIDPDARRITPENPSTVFLKDRVEEKAARFEETLEKTPVAYPFNFDTDRFPFVFGVAQFRAGTNADRIEVDVEFPVEARDSLEVGATRIYDATAVLLDADYREVDRVERQVTVPVGDEPRTMPAQLVFLQPPGYYRLAVSMRETRRYAAPVDSSGSPYRRRRSAWRATVPRRDFDGELTLSDILFARRIAPVTGVSPFARGAIEVVPHPARRYAAGSRVPIYFEVYNLHTGVDGLTDWEVEYRIVPLRVERRHLWERFAEAATVVSSRFEGSGRSATEPIHVTIATDNLPPGTYEMLVRVTDRAWQSSVSRRATFRIVRGQ